MTNFRPVDKEANRQKIRSVKPYVAVTPPNAKKYPIFKKAIVFFSAFGESYVAL
jgi:hypothetical protein